MSRKIKKNKSQKLNPKIPNQPNLKSTKHENPKWFSKFPKSPAAAFLLCQIFQKFGKWAFVGNWGKQSRKEWSWEMDPWGIPGEEGGNSNLSNKCQLFCEVPFVDGVVFQEQNSRALGMKGKVRNLWHELPTWSNSSHKNLWDADSKNLFFLKPNLSFQCLGEAPRKPMEKEVRKLGTIKLFHGFSMEKE